jgi:hypothetical protein
MPLMKASRPRLDADLGTRSVCAAGNIERLSLRHNGMVNLGS